MTDLQPNNEFQDFSLVAAENEYLIREDNLSISRPGLWPSEASVEYVDDHGKVVHGKCMRAAFYRAMDYPEDGCRNSGLQMKAELGKRAEAGCIDRWKGMGVWVANNIKFYNHDIIVSGEMDSVIKHEPPGTQMARIGVEVKSFYGFYANAEICGRKRPAAPGKPKMDHFLQTLIYKHKYIDILDQYRLYYLERGDGHRIEFEVGLDPQGDDYRPFWRQIDGPYWATFRPEKVYTPFMMNNVLERYKTLLGHVRSRTLPDRDFDHTWSREQVEVERQRGNVGKTNYDKWKKNPSNTKLGNWQCSYCNFSDTCRNDTIGEAK